MINLPGERGRINHLRSAVHAVRLQARGRIGQDGGLIETELVVGPGGRARQDAREVAALLGVQGNRNRRPVNGAGTSFQNGCDGSRGRRPNASVDESRRIGPLHRRLDGVGETSRGLVTSVRRTWRRDWCATPRGA